MVFSERRYGVKAAFYTLGCKVNQYETQAMMKQMAAAGYEVEEHAGGVADVLVINSCTVTGESDRKLRQLLRRRLRDRACRPRWTRSSGRRRRWTLHSQARCG